MSFNLDSLIGCNEKRPKVITIAGSGGVGKSSMAALFPSPVFIKTEDGLASISHMKNVKSFPLCKKPQDVLDQIKALGTNDHEFKTLVIDSITQLNVLIEEELVSNDPRAQSINQVGGGYGAGYSMLSAEHSRIRRACDWLMNEKNMHIVFIAHVDIATVKPADADEYNQYTLRMHSKSVSHYSDNVDCVAFLKLRSFVTKTSGNRGIAKTDGKRVITCYPVPSHISKNRFGIEDDLVFEKVVNPLEQYL